MYVAVLIWIRFKWTLIKEGSLTPISHFEAGRSFERGHLKENGRLLDNLGRQYLFINWLPDPYWKILSPKSDRTDRTKFINWLQNTCCATIYTCWTAPSLTFNLLCRSRMMLDEAKLSPTSALICTTNRMLGGALPNKCFIMPKSLNDNTKIELALDKYLAARMTNIFKLITYWIRTHDGSQICYLVLIDLQILQRKFFSDSKSCRHTKGMLRKEVPSLTLHTIGKWIICTGHETIPRAHWILMEKYSHATSIRGE